MSTAACQGGTGVRWQPHEPAGAHGCARGSVACGRPSYWLAAPRRWDCCGLRHIIKGFGIWRGAGLRTVVAAVSLTTRFVVRPKKGAVGPKRAPRDQTALSRTTATAHGRLCRYCSAAMARAVSGCSRTHPSATICENLRILDQLRRSWDSCPARQRFAARVSAASGPICSLTHRSATGRAACQMSKYGVQPRQTPSTHHVFCNSTSLVGQHVEAPRGPNKWPQKRGRWGRRGRRAEDRLHNRRSAWAKVSIECCRRHEAKA